MSHWTGKHSRKQVQPVRQTAAPTFSPSHVPPPVGGVLIRDEDGNHPEVDPVTKRLKVDVGTSIDVGEVEVKNDAGNPVPISAASLPLPTGAATAAKQDTGNSSLASIDAKDFSTETTLAAIKDTAGIKKITDALPAGTNNIGKVTKDTPTALTASSPASASVGVTSGQVVAANASRKGLVLINTSIGNVSFGLGANAVLNNGITLTPFGVWVMDELTFFTGAINAIGSVGSQNLAIQEFV